MMKKLLIIGALLSISFTSLSQHFEINPLMQRLGKPYDKSVTELDLQEEILKAKVNDTLFFTKKTIVTMISFTIERSDIDRYSDYLNKEYIYIGDTGESNNTVLTWGSNTAVIIIFLDIRGDIRIAMRLIK